jgi:hypothetical protein
MPPTAENEEWQVNANPVYEVIRPLSGKEQPQGTVALDAESPDTAVADGIVFAWMRAWRR